MEKQALKAQADALEAELEMIKQRLGALEESE
jgi:prefoldin subunit 5